MIIILNGSLGVGKSSAAEELHLKFDKSVNLDGDYIADLNPSWIQDPSCINHLYRTLELLIGFHQKNGYPNFVINYVFEKPDSLQKLHNLLHPLDPNIHTYWLTCSKEEQAKRIQSRNHDNLNWELKRFVELQQIQKEAAKQGFIGIKTDTSGLTPPEVAGKIWNDIFENQENRQKAHHPDRNKIYSRDE